MRKCEFCGSSDKETKALTTGNGVSIGYHTNRWCLDCMIEGFPGEYIRENWPRWEDEQPEEEQPEED